MRQITSKQDSWMHEGQEFKADLGCTCKFQVVLHKTLSQNKAKQKQQYLAAKNILTS